MGQLLIRNVDDLDIAELKAQAARERISLEQRLREIVRRAARSDNLEARFQEVSRRSREQTRDADLDLDAILQEERDRDGCL